MKFVPLLIIVAIALIVRELLYVPGCERCGGKQRVVFDDFGHEYLKCVKCNHQRRIG